MGWNPEKTFQKTFRSSKKQTKFEVLWLFWSSSTKTPSLSLWKLCAWRRSSQSRIEAKLSWVMAAANHPTSTPLHTWPQTFSRNKQKDQYSVSFVPLQQLEKTHSLQTRRYRNVSDENWTIFCDGEYCSNKGVLLGRRSRFYGCSNSACGNHDLCPSCYNLR